MRLGTSIFLIAVGAILTFAVSFTLSGVDVHTVGIILMLVGLIGIVLEFALFRPRVRRTTSVTRANPATSTTTHESTARDI